ncbi:MAG: PorP/SprF family type IX secretion system membrane protein, partial [Bacteroidetes bacterium]|nr:PorP/SprF family type IX secretion system membrane protein [Bacteroidota bacterium]
ITFDIMVKRILVVFTAILIGSNIVSAQDPEFTQFYANRLYLNPAFAGEVKCPRIALNYRNQWPKLGSTYVTYAVSYDQYVRWVLGGVGVHIFRDVQGHGAITTTNISAMYAYTISISRKFSVKGGFQASYFQKRLAWDFIFPDMIDPLYGVIYVNHETDIQNQWDKNNIHYFDFSAGLLGFSEEYYFGFACHHLTAPPESHRDNSDAVLPRKYTVHFGTNIPISGRNLKKGELYLSPNILFQQQQDFQQLNYGIYANRKSIVVGIWLRQNFNFHYDSFIMVLGYSTKKIKFAYSYDLTVSKLRNQTLGAHEVAYIMVFNCKPPPVKFRTISCPSF